MASLEQLIGQRLDKYDIQAEIGRGGMGVVFRGYDTTLQRPVAIKVLPPRFTFDREFVQRFHREAVMAANLHHTNVVTIHDVGQQDDLHYIVMELLEGATLDEWLAQHGSLSLEQANHVVRQIAAALDYAHSRGIVHRDIKPSNVMIGPDGHVTLMDFGLVRAGEGTALTRTGIIMGTPEYMAPEQALGTTVTGSADIYSLGVVIYHMLTGQVPFARSTPYAVTYAHIHEPPPPLREVRPKLPQAVEDVVMKALSKTPGDRYQHAGQLAKALDAAVSGAAVSLESPTQLPGRRPADTATRLVGAAAREAGVAERQRKKQRPRRSSLALPMLLGITGLLLIAVVVAFWALMQDGRRSGVTPAPPAAANGPDTPLPEPAATVADTAQAVSIETLPAEPSPANDQMAAEPRSTDTPAPPTKTATPTRRQSSSATPSPTKTPVPASAKPVAVAESQVLNVRGGPGTGYAIVGQIRGGDQAEIIGRNDDSSWWQVALADGTQGWVLASLVTAQGPVDQVAAAPTPTRQPTSTSLPTPSRPGLVLDFERDIQWKRGDQPYGTLQSSTEQVQAGQSAGKLSYDFPAVPDNYVVLMPQPAPALGNATGLVAWVYGDGAGHFLNAWAVDSGGEVRSYTFGQVTHNGWARMTAWFDDEAGWPNGHISGNDNGQLDPPATLYALVLDGVPDGQASQGAIYIDEMFVTREEIPATDAQHPPQPTPTAASEPPPATAGATLERPPSAQQVVSLSGWLGLGAVLGVALLIDWRRVLHRNAQRKRWRH